MTSKAQRQLQHAAKNCLKIDMFSKRKNAEKGDFEMLLFIILEQNDSLN
jgi:hypothetical protein